ncbi:nucleotidyltransferase family protein [Paenibacillus psychroresistens]|nr:NTP transferase domain-containing protein [Paenibacillus psychroresistens]
MGQPKLSIKLSNEERLGSKALKAAFLSELYHIIIVARASDNLEWLPAEYEEESLLKRSQVLICEEADFGISYSLRFGLGTAKLLKADAIVVMLADQPFITSEMINKLIGEFYKNPAVDYIASGDAGRKKPPILWNRSLFPRLAILGGDEGARSILLSTDYYGIVVDESLGYRFLDADTLEDLEKIKSVQKQL